MMIKYYRSDESLPLFRQVNIFLQWLDACQILCLWMKVSMVCMCATAVFLLSDIAMNSDLIIDVMGAVMRF